MVGPGIVGPPDGATVLLTRPMLKHRATKQRVINHPWKTAPGSQAGAVFLVGHGHRLVGGDRPADAALAAAAGGTGVRRGLRGVRRKPD